MMPCTRRATRLLRVVPAAAASEAEAGQGEVVVCYSKVQTNTDGGSNNDLSPPRHSNLFEVDPAATNDGRDDFSSKTFPASCDDEYHSSSADRCRPRQSKEDSFVSVTSESTTGPQADGGRTVECAGEVDDSTEHDTLPDFANICQVFGHLQLGESSNAHSIGTGGPAIPELHGAIIRTSTPRKRRRDVAVKLVSSGTQTAPSEPWWRVRALAEVGEAVCLVCDRYLRSRVRLESHLRRVHVHPTQAAIELGGPVRSNRSERVVVRKTKAVSRGHPSTAGAKQTRSSGSRVDKIARSKTVKPAQVKAPRRSTGMRRQRVAVKVTPHSNRGSSKQQRGSRSGKDLMSRHKSRSPLSPRPRSGRHVKPYKCDHCAYASYLSCNLKRHVLHQHSSLPRRFPCQHCPYAAKCRQHLQIHVQNKHSGGVRLYVCHHCSHTMKSKNGLTAHVRAKHGVAVDGTTAKLPQPFVCDACGYSTMFVQNLRRHVKQMHESVRQFACPHCRYRGKLAQHLRVHMAYSHSAERPHVCQLCDNYRGKTTSALRQHVRLSHATA